MLMKDDSSSKHIRRGKYFGTKNTIALLCVPLNIGVISHSFFSSPDCLIVLAGLIGVGCEFDFIAIHFS